MLIKSLRAEVGIKSRNQPLLCIPGLEWHAFYCKAAVCVLVCMCLCGGQVWLRWCPSLAGVLGILLLLHLRQLLPPIGELAEGVTAGEVRRVTPHQQGEDVVHHLPQTNIG